MLDRKIYTAVLSSYVDKDLHGMWKSSADKPMSYQQIYTGYEQ